MKRAIDVKEEKLIEKLNSQIGGNVKKLYEAPEARVLEDTVTLTPRNEDGTFAEVLDVDYNAEDVKESRETINRENKGTHLRTSGYEMVNHPKHYNNYDVEVIDMMEKIFGLYDTYAFCKLNAYKYRMRAGTKPGTPVQQDLDKEQWYLTRAENIKSRMTDTDRERATEFSKNIEKI